ncbi:alpha/beta fold hydrolase [Flindersiella endophytica]
MALNVRAHGTGRPRVLYVHGISSHGETWWHVGAAIAEAGHPGLAVDLRGHGESPRAGDYRAAAYAADVAALEGQWDLVVGHSLGGLIVAAAAPLLDAAQYLLVDPVLELSDEESTHVRDGELATKASPPTYEELAAANPRWPARDVEVSLEGVAMVDAEALRLTMDQNTPWHHTALLSSITSPTLVLGGDPDHGAMTAPSLAASSGNPLVTYQQVTGAGHIIQRDDPRALIQAALSLLG